MSQPIGVLAAIASSTLGGIAAAVTRFVIGTIDPVTIAAFRFGTGFLFLLPVALALGSKWPRGKDWLGVAGLGVLFFALFFVTYNVSLAYTTAARGTLALSVLPLLTMVAAALLGVERLTPRKSLGVAVAVGGVAFALASSLSEAPPGAWRGDLIMVAGTTCMALYNVWSRPFIARSDALGFACAGMGFGGIGVSVIAGLSGGIAVAADFGVAQWLAVAYLGAFGGALAFFLWAFALARATPTQVASTIAVNPLAASAAAAILLDEAVGVNFLVGVAAVLAGIWIAASTGRVSVAPREP